MRKLIKLAIVAIGTRAFMRWWKGRKQTAPAPAAVTPAEDPADELRRKLAASRDEDDPTVEAPAPEAVGDRRTEVHEQGRATLDEMNSTTED